MEAPLKTNRRNVHWVPIVAVSIMLAVVGIIGMVIWLGNNSPPEITLEQIAGDHALFNSVINDRSDIAKGEFTRFPWTDDTFILRTSVLPEITQNTKRTTKLSGDGRNFSVETTTDYWVYFSDYDPVSNRLVTAEADVLVELRDQKVAIPVKIAIGMTDSLPSISERTARAIAKLDKGSHALQMKVAYYPRNTYYPRHRYIDELSDIKNLLSRLQQRAEADWTEKEHKRILSENEEYQALLKQHSDALTGADFEKLTEIEKNQYRRQWDLKAEAWRQSRVLPSNLFDPITALRDYIFILPVKIQAIDGIKLKSPD